jgi:putative colanic acid biosynthesis acetyltransferase WcaF
MEANTGVTDLSSFTNNWYDPGRGPAIRMLWLITEGLFFRHSLAIGSGWKCAILRLFGARVGVGVVIKPSVSIKYPWKLSIGDHAWVGEHVWIDNLDSIEIGVHVCISQGALLLCGSHDYTRSAFDLITKPIVLEHGAWVGAKSIVCPGVTLYSHAVLAAGSVATKSLEAFAIYQGNPAVYKRTRIISDTPQNKPQNSSLHAS